MWSKKRSSSLPRPFEGWFDAWAFVGGLREVERQRLEGWVCFDGLNVLRFLGRG